MTLTTEQVFLLPFLGHFGRVARRSGRDDRLYLGWVELAACVIFIRAGFFP